jgi:hypothetical protein
MFKHVYYQYSGPFHKERQFILNFVNVEKWGSFGLLWESNRLPDHTSSSVAVYFKDYREALL